MPAEAPACVYCKFWERVNQDTGLCHRFPPANRFVSGNAPIQVFFPTTTASSWCGWYEKDNK